MKILFVIPEYPPHAGGGIVTFYVNLLPELVRLGHEPHVLAGSAFSGKLAGYESNGIKVRFLDPEAVQRNLERFSAYSALPELQKHLAAAWAAWEQANGGEDYDLVETTDWGMLFVPWIVERDGPPTLVQLHGSVGQINHYDPKRGEELQGVATRLIEMQLLACADELQTYSKNNAREWESLTGRQIRYIPPAWRLASTSSVPAEQANSGLVVARIQHWKGPTTLCEAIRRLGADAPEIHWVGRDTPYRDSGMSMSDYLFETYPDIWGKKVIPVGSRSPEETARMQAAARFVIVPSNWDVFNFTCIEAMGHSRVVACSQGAGASGLIDDGRDGLTFAPGDSTALADLLGRICRTSAETMDIIGTQARRKLEAELMPQRVAEQRVEAYLNLLKHGKSEPKPNEWLSRDLRPCEPAERNLAFLDCLPLREISTYALSRTVRKILN